MKYSSLAKTWSSLNPYPPPVKPKTSMGRRILETYLVYDTVKKKKYIAEKSIRLTTFEEVDTNRPHTHTNYDGSERLLPVNGLKIEQLRWYVDTRKYNEMELRNMVLGEIKKHKSVFMKEKVNVFRDVCKRFDRCEKMVKMASVEHFDNINQANVAYRLLMREYGFIIKTLMREGGKTNGSV